MEAGFGYGGPEVPAQPEQWASPQPSGWQPEFRQWRAFRPLGTRATLAVAGLVAAIGVQVVWITTWLSFRAKIHRFGLEDFMTVAQQIHDANQRLSLIVPLDLIVAFAAGAFFIAWLYRAYKNLGALGAEAMRHQPGWAIGGWFIPIVNLVLPKRIVDDLWRASDPEGPASRFSTWGPRRVPSLYNWWWLLWILSNFVWGFGFAMQNASRNVAISSAGWLRGNEVVIAANIGLIVAAALGIRVILVTTRRQEARADRLMNDSPEPEPQPYTATVWAGS